VAKKNGIARDKLEACFNDQAAADALNARVKRHSEQGVDSTPTFVVNGTKLPDLDHEANLADLDAAIQPLLKPGGR
jgi:predicted DsbA family dithiol-disulfide isomerase